LIAGFGVVGADWSAAITTWRRCEEAVESGFFGLNGLEGPFCVGETFGVDVQWL
jgi:hypothetical protein